MKKIIAVLSAFALVFVLSYCSKSADTSPTSPTKTTTTTATKNTIPAALQDTSIKGNYTVGTNGFPTYALSCCLGNMAANYDSSIRASLIAQPNLTVNSVHVYSNACGNLQVYIDANYAYGTGSYNWKYVWVYQNTNDTLKMYEYYSMDYGTFKMDTTIMMPIGYSPCH